MKEQQADVVIIGGGTGGCAAALAAGRLGRHVLMTEPTDWIGGQMTSQAVPPDEHPWIEKFGCTRSWRRFRDGVRASFRDNFPLAGEVRIDERMHLGGALVTRVPCPPQRMMAARFILVPAEVTDRDELRRHTFGILLRIVIVVPIVLGAVP